MKYGQLPTALGIYKVDVKEMMFYQYLPVKMPNDLHPIVEQRLSCFDIVLGEIFENFLITYGLERYVKSYAYITAKNMYQMPGCSYNRPGWHSDGFLTDDINYIWCNNHPTIFNNSDFNLTLNDTISLQEMELQANPFNNVMYSSNQLLRLNQYNIHKVAEILTPGMRAFLKVSFSYDKYNLVGNSHNYFLNYNWEMKDRKPERNIPQQ